MASDAPIPLKRLRRSRTETVEDRKAQAADLIEAMNRCGMNVVLVPADQVPRTRRKKRAGNVQEER